MRHTPRLLVAAIAGIGLPMAPAFAQSADDVVTGETVTVTARRQTERMVDVPASVDWNSTSSAVRSAA